MDVINAALGYLQDLAVQADTVYHVNPWIFGILFFGSALPLYYGYYRIGRAVIKIEDGKIVRKHINKKELKIGVTISSLAWILPYMYVLVFGKLPLDIFLIFIAVILIMGIFFAKTLVGKISKTVAETKK